MSFKNLCFIISITSFIFINFLNLLLPMDQILSFFGWSTLVFGLLQMRFRGLEFFLPISLVMISVYIGFTSIEDNNWFVIWEGSTKMSLLVTMATIVPVVSWVFKQKDYIQDVFTLCGSAISNTKILYFVNMFLTQILSFFLLFGTLPLMYQFISTLLKDKMKSEYWQVFISTSLLRGFAMSTMWVFSIPSFAFAVQALEVSLIKAFFQGLIFAILASVGGMVFLLLFEKKNKIIMSTNIFEEINQANPVNLNTRRNVIEFIIIFSLLIVPIFIINQVFHIGLLVIIPLAVLLWSVCYFVLNKNFTVFRAELKDYLSKGILLRSREASMLISAGILITVLQESGISASLIGSIYEWSKGNAWIDLINILPIIILILSYCGLGPLTGMVLMAEVINDIHLPYAPELIVLSLTMGSALSLLLSPIIIPSIVLSGLNGQSTIKNSFLNNWKYGLFIYIIAELYIMLRIM